MNSKRTGPSSRKQGTAKAPRNQHLMIGGGVLAGLLLVVILLWGAGVFSRGEQPDQALAQGESSPQPSADRQEHAAGEEAGDERRLPPDLPPPAPIEPLDLAWLPEDVEVLIFLRPADLWNAPLIRQFAESEGLQEFAEQMELKTGHHPSDIDSVLIGLRGAAELAESAPQAPSGVRWELPLHAADQTGAVAPGGPPVAAALGASLGAPPELDDIELDGLVVIRSRVPLNRQKIVASWGDSEAAEHQGTIYHRMVEIAADETNDDAPPAEPAPPGRSRERIIGLYFPDDRTLLAGPEEHFLRWIHHRC